MKRVWSFILVAVFCVGLVYDLPINLNFHRLIYIYCPFYIDSPIH